MAAPAIPRPSREQIYEALFGIGANTRVNGEKVFKTYSRRWQHWDKVPADQQPALFQVQRKEEPRTGEKQGMPARWTFHVDWLIYVNAGMTTTAVTSTLLNPILDAIEAVLPYRPAGPIGVTVDYQRLGFPPGSVQEVRVMDEEIEINEGLLAPQSQAVAIIPIRIIRT